MTEPTSRRSCAQSRRLPIAAGPVLDRYNGPPPERGDGSIMGAGSPLNRPGLGLTEDDADSVSGAVVDERDRGAAAG